jgi:hypothetical protein
MKPFGLPRCGCHRRWWIFDRLDLHPHFPHRRRLCLRHFALKIFRFRLPPELIRLEMQH